MWLTLPLWHQWKRAILLLGLLPLLSSSWGCFPCLSAFDIPMNNLSPFDQGISLWCNVENTLNILPLWPSLLLELCLCSLSSNVGLFSRYATDKYLLLESWEEEWPPLWICLPIYSLQDEQCATIWWSLDLFMHQTHPISRIMNNNEIKNHDPNINHVPKCAH
jgi:hypothetical protein